MTSTWSQWMLGQQLVMQGLQVPGHGAGSGGGPWNVVHPCHLRRLHGSSVPLRGRTQEGPTLVEMFADESRPSIRLGVMRHCRPFPLDRAWSPPASIHPARGSPVHQGLAFRPSIVTRPELCRVAGITGHVAESIAEWVLDELGSHVLWHFGGARTPWRRPLEDSPR